MKQLGVAELQALCSGSAPPPLLLDVREPWEAQIASIRIAGVPQLLLPMGQLAERLDELDPRQPVVCYCHHGMRSLQVVAFLLRQGFETVYNLAGGIEAWSLQVDPAVPRY
jgi:rhodanese-related sulfurtransferase